jgi:hypothetical protein
MDAKNVKQGDEVIWKDNRCTVEAVSKLGALTLKNKATGSRIFNVAAKDVEPAAPALKVS